MSTQSDTVSRVSTVSTSGLQRMAKLVMTKQNIMTVWPVGNGRTHAAQEIRSGTLSYFKDISAQFRFVYLDQSLGIEFAHEQILDDFVDHEGSYRSALRKSIAAGEHLVFLIDNFRRDEEFLKFIAHLRALGLRQVSFIAFANVDDYIRFKNAPGSFGFLLQNTVDVPYLEKEHYKSWLEQTLLLLDLALTSQDKIRLEKLCWRIPQLNKAILRLLAADYQLSKIIQKPNHVTERIILEFWDKFTVQEKKFFRELALGINTAAQAELLEYYSRLNLIKDGRVMGSWLELCLRILSRSEELDLSEGRVTLGELDLSNKLSYPEHNLLAELIKQGMLTRDTAAAAALLGKNYSDWALDKFISRLRKSLREVGIEREVVKTLKGKGYRFVR